MLGEVTEHLSESGGLEIGEHLPRELLPALPLVPSGHQLVDVGGGTLEAHALSLRIVSAGVTRWYVAIEEAATPTA
jgi:hypothetical protein